MYTTNISIKAFLGWGLSPRVCSLDCCKAPPASIITQFVKQAMCWCGGVGAPRANNEPTGSLVCKQVRKEEWQGNNSVSLTGEGLTSWRGGKWFVPADWHRLQKKKPTSPTSRLRSKDLRFSTTSKPLVLILELAKFTWRKRMKMWIPGPCTQRF